MDNDKKLRPIDFIKSETILDAIGDEQKIKEIYLKQSAMDNNAVWYGIDENVRKARLLEYLAFEKQKEKIFSKVILSYEAIDLIFQYSKKDIHEKLALELTKYINNSWFDSMDRECFFGRMLDNISEDVKIKISKPIMDEYFGEEFVLLLFQDDSIQEKHKYIKEFVDSKKQDAIVDFLLELEFTSSVEIIWKNADIQVQEKYISEIFNECFLQMEYNLINVIWNNTNTSLQEKIIKDVVQWIVRSINLYKENNELIGVTCAIWNGTDKKIINNMFSELMEIVSKNKDLFYNILVLCYPNLVGKQFTMMMEQFKDRPEILNIVSHYLSENSYRQKEYVKRKFDNNNDSEKEFIKSIIYYELALGRNSIEDGIKKFIKYQEKEQYDELLNKLPKDHPANVHYKKINLNKEEFEKMITDALAKMTMYQMIREHDSLGIISSEQDIDNLVDYISNEYKVENLIKYIMTHEDNLLLDINKFKMYLKIFYRLYNPKENSEIIKFIKGEYKYVKLLNDENKRKENDEENNYSEVNATNMELQYQSYNDEILLDKFTRLYGVNCTYDMIKDSIEKHFVGYNIKYMSDFIMIEMDGNRVSINTKKSKPIDDIKNKIIQLHSFVKHSRMPEGDLKEYILNQISRFDCEYTVNIYEKEGNTDATIKTNKIIREIAIELNLFIRDSNRNLYAPDGRLFISISKGESDFTSLPNKNKEIKEETQQMTPKNVTLYGVDCSYDMFVSKIEKYFREYKISYKDNLIVVEIDGTDVVIEINTSDTTNQEQYISKQAYGMCTFFSNTSMNLDRNLEKDILKQILAFNCIFGISFSEKKGEGKIEEVIIGIVYKIAKEFNLFVLYPSMELYDKEEKLIISLESKECEITKLNVILPENFNNTIAERIIRRAISNARIKKEGIACFEELPCIEASSEVRLKDIDTICKRAIACLLTIQIVYDIKKGKYEQSKKTINELLERYGVKDCLNSKERKLFDGTYQEQDLIDLDWEYEAYWSLIWALGIIGDISDGSSVCDCDLAIRLVVENKTYENFKAICNLRDVNEILDMLDLYFRYHWAVEDKRINPQINIGTLNPSVVVERRRGLEWLVSSEDDWYNVQMNT